MIKLFEVRGTNYDMGKQIGENFKDYLKKIIIKYEEKILDNDVYIKVKELEKKLKEEFPKCLEEIYGRADGANVSRDALLLCFFPEIFKQVDGCTTVILKKKNNTVLFSHNEDDRNYNINNIALIKYNYEDYCIYGYTMAEKLTGSSFAFNSYGLIFSSNYIYDTKIDLDNISRYIMVRDVMDSKNIDEVIRKMKIHKVASAFSLNILDINKNQVINIEKDIDEIYITNIIERYARANHFIAKNGDLPEEPVSSNFRYIKSKELLDGLNTEQSSIDDLINILNYQTDDYYKSIYKDSRKYRDKSVTVANFSVDSETKRIEIYDYLGNHVFEFKVDDVMGDMINENIKL